MLLLESSAAVDNVKSYLLSGLFGCKDAVSCCTQRDCNEHQHCWLHACCNWLANDAISQIGSKREHEVQNWRQVRHLLLRLRIPLQGVRQVLELAETLVQLPLRPRPAPLQTCRTGFTAVGRSFGCIQAGAALGRLLSDAAHALKLTVAAVRSADTPHIDWAADNHPIDQDEQAERYSATHLDDVVLVPLALEGVVQLAPLLGRCFHCRQV